MHVDNQAQCFLVFTQGEATFALPAARVNELLSLPRLSPLDETAPWVIGGFDLHGALTPVVSLVTWLGEPLPAAHRGDLVIVIEVRGDPLGIHADAVLGNEPAPLPGGPAPLPAFTGGVPEPTRVALPGGSALWLDPGRLPLAADPRVSDPAEERLGAFERGLIDTDLAELEHRAHRYGDLGVRLRRTAMSVGGSPAGGRPAHRD